MNELDNLYRELEEVSSTTPELVCEKYNADSKGEILALINAEINSIESDEEDYEQGEEIERERTDLCLSQGISRFC